MTPGGAILNKIMTGLDWSHSDSIYNSILIVSRSPCPGPGGHQGTSHLRTLYTFRLQRKIDLDNDLSVCVETVSSHID